MTITEGMSYIYTLSDPDTQEVRYVGCSRNPQRRYSQHLSDTCGVPFEKTDWLDRLLCEGKRPVMTVIESLPHNKAAAAEQRWIKHYRELGADLVNDNRRYGLPITFRVSSESHAYLYGLSRKRKESVSAILRRLLDAMVEGRLSIRKKETE